MRRRSLVVMVVFLMGTSLVGMRSTSAHNIDLKKARELGQAWATLMKVVEDSRSNN